MPLKMNILKQANSEEKYLKGNYQKKDTFLKEELKFEGLFFIQFT